MCVAEQRREPLTALRKPLAGPSKPQAGRTAAERKPLAASRNPLAGRKARRAGFLRTYGWRVGVIPALLAVTALVVTDSLASPANSTPAQPAAAAPAGPGPAPEQSVHEAPAKPQNLTADTAALPGGGPFTQAGAGTWHIIPGTGKRVGDAGKLYHYTIEVEDGLDPSSYSGDDAFATAVEGILSDAKSWTQDGKVSLQRVDATYPKPDFRVSLTSPSTTHRPDACGFDITFEASCYRSSLKRRVLINLSRWAHGALAYAGNLTEYREYAINHEVGHALGHLHVGCGGDNTPAPVMMQQSFGVADDYVAKLNDIPGGDQGAVPADHRVCKPNPWPFPA
ncbi:DUF3152 domain-containing protein [Amycolatopsis benzoatilytica]|uniref:DUF3152 domain-containing protein n=1 Tax=Amycolatopsis benzoatilytica TaxID=346045 RepID=UPI000A02E26E